MKVIAQNTIKKWRFLLWLFLKMKGRSAEITGEWFPFLHNTLENRFANLIEGETIVIKIKGLFHLALCYRCNVIYERRIRSLPKLVSLNIIGD